MAMTTESEVLKTSWSVSSSMTLIICEISALLWPEKAMKINGI